VLGLVDGTLAGLCNKHSCKGLGVEGSDGVVLYGAADFNGVAADFTVFHVGLLANRKVHDHRNLFATIRANEKVFHSGNKVPYVQAAQQ
jgi:hypothetical protein